MVTFRDGPAAGVILDLRRAPQLLRVVQSPAGWDALDALDDSPQEDERITVYRLDVSTLGRYHLLIRGRGRRGSGWRMRADYWVLAQQPPDSDVRTTEAWREWAYSHAETPE
jgi:hypothetical protein